VIGTLIQLDIVYVSSEGQGHRSTFTVTKRNAAKAVGATSSGAFSRR